MHGRSSSNHQISAVARVLPDMHTHTLHPGLTSFQWTHTQSKSRYFSKSTHKYPKPAKPALVSFGMPTLKRTYRNNATNMKRYTLSGNLAVWSQADGTTTQLLVQWTTWLLRRVSVHFLRKSKFFIIHTVLHWKYVPKDRIFWIYICTKKKPTKQKPIENIRAML